MLSLSPFSPHTQKKGQVRTQSEAVYKPGSRPSPETKFTSTLTLDLWLPEL